MSFYLTLEEICDQDRPRVGGKAFSLARMARKGMQIPFALCLTTDAYEKTVEVLGLREKIFLEINRKAFEDMRWEEIWDASLRIRNLFINTPIPEDLRRALLPPLEKYLSDKTVAVRSSAPGEDAAKTSFAGLHESFICITGAEAILEHIPLVWASLWSDRALLYRRELGLDVEKSTMAVVIQEMIAGDRSGVAFGMNPLDPSQSVIEAVHGLNQGLVDGTIEPDRWVLRRRTGEILSYVAARRDQALFFRDGRVRSLPLTKEKTETPPLEEDEIGDVFRLTRAVEELFDAPQDVEWTYREESLHTLQSRPITSGTPASEGDQRPWYLSLHRSIENLKVLRVRIEQELIPAMEAEASRLAGRSLGSLSDPELAQEIDDRNLILQKWEAIYKEFCIPFAHGMRLFGQIYNDLMKPADPYAFLDLLGGRGLISLERNGLLEEMAGMIRQEPDLSRRLKETSREDWEPSFREKLEGFLRKYGDLTWGEARFDEHAEGWIDLLTGWTKRSAGRVTEDDFAAQEGSFLASYSGKNGEDGKELLEIARASYRLRDNDNIYMGKIRGQMISAVQEGKRRLKGRKSFPVDGLSHQELAWALMDKEYTPPPHFESGEKPSRSDLPIRGRQLVGQPAGSGIAVGKARLVLKQSDLFSFQPGEILVCDAIDPNMTFVVPLASAVVERRGGMLIHGAIIAREYGLPCITGVPEATRWIKTGDTLTVDGFLGIVTIGEPSFLGSQSDARIKSVHDPALQSGGPLGCPVKPGRCS